MRNVLVSKINVYKRMIIQPEIIRIYRTLTKGFTSRNLNEVKIKIVQPKYGRH